MNHPESNGRDGVQSDARALAGAFAGSRVLVTGGLGFIGSTLALRLAEAGADVLVLDASLPGSGANPFNLDGSSRGVAVADGDVRDDAAMRRHLAGRDYLFNLAAQTSHQGSMAEPLLDLDINCRAQLAILEAVRAVAPKIRIVYASTRQLYGRPRYLPVDEKHPVEPPDVNGVDKAAAEHFHALYHRVYGIRGTALRLTNVYGPRMRIKDARQNFLGVWLRAALEGGRFELWGGDQRRDMTYVDDAVDAFLRAALSVDLDGRAVNVGGTPPLSLKELAGLVVDASGGRCSYELREFPEERKRIDIGDFFSDDTLFRGITGWAPRISMADGLARSLDFFRRNLTHYL